MTLTSGHNIYVYIFVHMSCVGLKTKYVHEQKWPAEVLQLNVNASGLISPGATDLLNRNSQTNRVLF